MQRLKADTKFEIAICCKILNGGLRALEHILSANEKLPVSKFRYFVKYIIQLFGYCYVHASGQQQAGLER